MPELPDVQVFKEYLDATVLHHRVEHARLDAERELRDVSARGLAATLRDRTLERTRRHGKHLFVELGEGPERWLRLHFGMTGYLEAWQGDAGEAPEHTRLALELDGGWHLAYVCQRRFGEIGRVQDPDDFVAERSLGPDPWHGMDAGAFRERLEGHRGAIKTTLMDQEILAGLGNVYTDEILFQAGIHPETSVPDLGPEALRHLHGVMERVLRTAVEARARPEDMPRRWLLRRREEGRACPRCDGEIRKTEVGGRPTYHCPKHQAKP